MPNTLTLTVEVEDQFLNDIMTNTVETPAINYWAGIHRVMRDKGLNVLSFCVTALDELEEDGAEAARYTINGSAIMTGLRRILDNSVFIADDIRSMIYTAVVEDDADIDAIGCDVIIQAAIFNEIRYS